MKNPMHETDFAEHRALAERYCNTGAHDCRWYHGNWHLLKALGLVSTSSIHHQNLMSLLCKAMPGNSAPRILITGSTDESLLAIVHAACRDRGVQAQIIALDICATPLQFMKHFARQQDIPFTTAQADILDFTAQQPFDLIVTHAFMGYFDAQQRQLLVKKWRHLLAENGRLVTIQRVRDPAAPELITFSAQQAAGFVAAATCAALSEGFTSPQALQQVTQAAAAFSGNFFAHAIRSKEAFENLLAESGFSIAHLEYQQLDSLNNLSGPSVPSEGEYAHIIAGKTHGDHVQES